MTMSLPEVLGGVAAAITAAVASYGAVTSKINSVVGKKEPNDDNSLRDLVMRVEGKIDAHHETTSERFRDLDKRLDRVEARVFTPPSRPAFRAISGKSE